MHLAAQAMNRDGAAAVTPALLAGNTGLSRNALYHYFPDKEALLFACYRDAAEEILNTAEMARDPVRTSREQLTALIKGLLDAPDHVAIFHDLDLLPPESAKSLRALQSKGLKAIRRIIDDGIKSGEFREINSGTAAHVLLGISEWARLWATWTGTTIQEPDQSSNAGMSLGDAIAHCLLHGFRRDVQPLHPPPPVDYLMSNAIDVLDREAVGTEKRLALLGVASQLFNRRGIGATSIDDIASAAGATKGLIYHHFDNKEALVDACYDRAFDIYERFADEAEGAAGTGAMQSLTWPMHLCAQAMLSRSPPLILQGGATKLPTRHRQRAVALAERFRRDMQCTIDKGIADLLCEGMLTC
jgi:AcrR family transcriptional regulator